MRSSKTKANGCVAAILVAALLTACQTAPPVQEMSDARQAIAVARQAGAAQHAVEPLREAERFLVDAQRNLTERAFGQARRNAVAAKNKALEALTVAESQQPQ